MTERKLKVFNRLLLSLAIGAFISLSSWYFIVRVVVASAVLHHKQETVYVVVRSNTFALCFVNALFFAVLIFVVATYVSRQPGRSEGS